MRLSVTLFVLHVTRLFIIKASDVRMPPAIVKGPEKDSHDFRDDDDYVLDCVAEGIPTPQYEWFRGDEKLTDFGGRIVHVTEGTIKIRQLGLLDEGSYQCRASNQFGTALSRRIVLKKAVLAQYPAKSITDLPEMLEGTRFTLGCQPTKWYPKPIFSWTLVENPEDKTDTPITPDQRIQIDDDGNLHFSYLLSGDSQNRRLYKCRLFNNVMDVTIGGSYTRLTVKPVPSIDPFAPVKMFSTNSPLTGLEKQQITMKCFFSGKPDPMISWSKDGASLPIGRYRLNNRNTELTINDLQPNDTGKYRCTAQNTQSQNVSEAVEVSVEAVPVFLSLSLSPHNMNVTEGTDTVVKCRTYAKPVATVEWYRNGEKLDPENLPRKFRLSAANDSLTISDVCKKCEDGSSDLMVIQCNATNIHGYAFVGGYINVLEKTTLTLHPENISMTIDEESGEFSVDAKTDDITPLTIRWYKIDRDGNRQVLHPDEPYVKISEDVKRVSFYLPHNTTKRLYYRGTYEAEASNTYSVAVAVVQLNTEERLPPPPPPEPAVAGIAELWWIIVLVVGLFLLLLLLLLCCFCCYRNRGDVYPVDKKERKNGNDPEKELADSGFFDYKRPEIQPVKGSQVSISSSLSVSDEEASLNEYGDIDAGKFTEEGSFIGDYAPSPNSKKNHSRQSKA